MVGVTPNAALLKRNRATRTCPVNDAAATQPARRPSARRIALYALLGVVVLVLVRIVYAYAVFPSDRTPQGAYLRVAIAVNRGRAEDFFAYLETRAQHAAYTIRDYRKKSLAR